MSGIVSDSCRPPPRGFVSMEDHFPQGRFLDPPISSARPLIPLPHSPSPAPCLPIRPRLRSRSFRNIVPATPCRPRFSLISSCAPLPHGRSAAGEVIVRRCSPSSRYFPSVLLHPIRQGRTLTPPPLLSHFATAARTLFFRLF